jgi:hypothetical protein
LRSEFGNAPVRGHWLTRPGGTGLARGVVADGKHKIEQWRAGFGKLTP